MKYYYTNAQNQPTGPVSLEELQTLLSSSAISQYANVIPVGGQQWVPITSVVRPQVSPSPVPQPVVTQVPPKTEPAPTPIAQPEPVYAPVARPAPSATPMASPAATPSPIASVAETPIASPVETPVARSIPTPVAAPSPSPTPAPSPEPIAVAAPVTYISAAVAAPAPVPEKPSMPLKQWPTFLADSMAAFLERARGLLSESLIKRSLSSAASSGQMLVLAGALVGLLMCTIIAFKPGQLFMLFVGLAVLISVAVLQYVAKRYLESCAELIKNSPSKMASSAFLDCLALISLLGAIFVLIGGFIASISIPYNQMLVLMGSVGAALVLMIASMMALHPRLTNTTIAPSTSGEEAMGIISYGMKVSVALAPMIFFVLSLVGFLSCTFSLLTSMGRRSAYEPTFGFDAGPMALLSAAPGTSGLLALVVATLSPFLIYLLFLLAHLQVDIIRAIVSIPGKLDALKDRN